jgi:hypothetical protein
MSALSENHTRLVSIFDGMSEDSRKFIKDLKLSKRQNGGGAMDKDASNTVQEINPATDAKIIEGSAPALTADNIIERTENDGATLIYEVEAGGKVLFSTLTRPLAFAFVAGHNAGMSGKGKPAKPVKPAKEGDAKPDTAPAVDPADVDASADTSADASASKSDDKAADKPASQPQGRKRSAM